MGQFKLFQRKVTAELDSTSKPRAFRVVLRGTKDQILGVATYVGDIELSGDLKVHAFISSAHVLWRNGKLVGTRNLMLAPFAHYYPNEFELSVEIFSVATCGLDLALVMVKENEVIRSSELRSLKVRRPSDDESVTGLAFAATSPKWHPIKVSKTEGQKNSEYFRYANYEEPSHFENLSQDQGDPRGRDSGGGIFGSDGALVGVHHGGEGTDVVFVSGERMSQAFPVLKRICSTMTSLDAKAANVSGTAFVGSEIESVLRRQLPLLEIGNHLSEGNPLQAACFASLANKQLLLVDGDNLRRAHSIVESEIGAFTRLRESLTTLKLDSWGAYSLVDETLRDRMRDGESWHAKIVDVDWSQFESDVDIIELHEELLGSLVGREGTLNVSDLASQVEGVAISLRGLRKAVAALWQKRRATKILPGVFYAGFDPGAHDLAASVCEAVSAFPHFEGKGAAGASKTADSV